MVKYSADVVIILLVAINFFVPVDLQNTAAVSSFWIIFVWLFFETLKLNWFSLSFNPIRMALIIFVGQLAVGSSVFYFDFVTVRKDYDVFLSWKHYGLNVAIILIYILMIRRFAVFFEARLEGIASKTINMRVSITPLILLLPSFIFELDLSLLGGQGDFSILIKTAFACYLVVYISQFSMKVRILSYVFLICIFATFSIHDKREAVFLIFPILWIEGLIHKAQFRLRNVLFLGVALLLLVYLILVMSIARGYGGFGTFDTLSEAAEFVPDYVKSEDFVGSFANNIEASYTFFHAINSLEIINSSAEHIAYGENYIKPFFSFVPRSIMADKPRSILTLYTEVYDPIGRADGGSWVIGAISESYWNFHIIGLFVFGVVVWAVIFWFLRLLVQPSYFKISVLSYVYISFLTYFRGSGIDQFIIYLLIGVLFLSIARLRIGFKNVRNIL